jgi:hypothetical protein
MKDSIAYKQDATAIKQHECSEKTCINCFENRGCMYEQYVIAAMQAIEESYPVQQQREDRNPPIWKQADINSINYPSQTGLNA